MGKYRRPRTISEFKKTRYNYLGNVDALIRELADKFRGSLDEDESANYDESRKKHAGSKRSLDDFLSDELVENEHTRRVAREIVSEVREFRMALRRG
jgi:hypothetical protein